MPVDLPPIFITAARTNYALCDTWSAVHWNVKQLPKSLLATNSIGLYGGLQTYHSIPGEILVKSVPGSPLVIVVQSPSL